MTTRRKHPPLEALFRCDDESALMHGHVTSHDPPPGAWSHHSAPLSPLGKVTFPEMIGNDVLTLVRGTA